MATIGRAQLRDILDKLSTHIGGVPEPYPLDRIPTSNLDRADHVQWMVYHMRDMLESPDADTPELREKLMRWLGFVQGVAWSLGVVDVQTLADWTRPQ